MQETISEFFSRCDLFLVEDIYYKEHNLQIFEYLLTYFDAIGREKTHFVNAIILILVFDFLINVNY